MLVLGFAPLALTSMTRVTMATRQRGNEEHCPGGARGVINFEKGAASPPPGTMGGAVGGGQNINEVRDHVARMIVLRSADR